jgi:hypothetical protein
VILDWLTQDFTDPFARDCQAHVAFGRDAKAEFRNLVLEAAQHLGTRDLVLLPIDTSCYQGVLCLK